MKKIVHFDTLGCRLNQDESEGAARVFYLNGFDVSLEGTSAQTPVNEDVILSVINTCTVTSKAEQKARRIIRLMLEKYPLSLVLVTGCYAELDKEEISSICPDRILILPGKKKFLITQIAPAMKNGLFDCQEKNDCLEKSGCQEKNDCQEKSDCQEKNEKPFLSFKKLDDFIKENLSLLGKIEDENLKEKNNFLQNPGKNNSGILNIQTLSKLDNFSLYTPVFEKHSRPSIKIQDGCNNECTFCRIHLARGKSISLDADKVLARVKELEEGGASEVVFTGVNLSQYAGKTVDGRVIDFASLLELLIKETSFVKFRISSFYPQHITDRLCKILSSPRVQPFFHLSVQSGSDKILKAMKRPYDAECVLNAVKLLRIYKHAPFISTDIIAGFPGESEEDFALTKKLCQQASFSWIHAFPFSPRKGTPAYDMKNQIPERIKDERVKWLFENAIENKIKYIERFLNEELSAITENSRSLRLKNQSENIKIVNCVTENFIHVQIPFDQEIPNGKKINVKITKVLEENIRGGKEVEAEGKIILG